MVQGLAKDIVNENTDERLVRPGVPLPSESQLIAAERMNDRRGRTRDDL